MTKNYFTLDEFYNVKKQRNNCLIFFFSMLFVYLVISIALVLFYTTLPYKSEHIWKIKAIHYSITLIFVIFSAIYLGIKFKRVNSFYNVYLAHATAKCEVYDGAFVEYDSTLYSKDGIDTKSIIFVEYNKYKEEYFERKVLVPFEKEFPQFSEGQCVRYYTQNNFLIKYEIEE